jgi:two-component system cell cycle sensor histidine kinase/response regulator CckA
VPADDRPHVLIVDDDASICAAYRQILGAHRYDVTTAGSRAEALAAIDRVDGRVDVLVLDIGLPDADGAEVAREIHQRIGPRPTLYVSGWTDEFWNLSDAPTPWLVMQKPIPIPKLLESVDFLAGRRDARPD